MNPIKKISYMQNTFHLRIYIERKEIKWTMPNTFCSNSNKKEKHENYLCSTEYEKAKSPEHCLVIRVQ